MQKELELRGRLTEEEFLASTALLEAVTRPIKNNKKSQFFTFSKGILKVSRHENPKSVVLSVKIGNEFTSNLEEYESTFADGSYEQLIMMLQGLGYTPKEEVYQKRIDYVIDGCTISLKHTNSWGYHFEAEKMIPSSAEDEARAQLSGLCERFGLRPMSPKELEEFIKTL